jgi:hypothetical membrane protein
MSNGDLFSSSSGPGAELSIRLGAAVWILAIQFFIAQFIVQSAWTTPFSLTKNYISDLGNTACGPYPTDSSMVVCSPWYAWMNASFIFLGMTILFGAALIRGAFRTGRMWAAGLSLVALAGLGLIAVGLFPENINIAAHKIGAGAQFISGNLGLVVLGAAMLQAGRRPVLAVYSIASGLVGLLATALFVSDHYLGAGIGGMERLAAYPLPFWLVVAGSYFVQTRQRLGYATAGR